MSPIDDLEFDPGTAPAEVPAVDIEPDPSDVACGEALWQS